jgi:hypothetical protein
VTESVRPDDMRISDTDRERVQDQLERAHVAGQLDLGEFDERVRGVWAARTRGQLAEVTSDLPDPPDSPDLPSPRAPAARNPVFSHTGGGVAMRVLTIVFACITAVNLSTWTITALTSGELPYPWWLSNALPPAVVLGVLYAAGIGRPPRRR